MTQPVPIGCMMPEKMNPLEAKLYERVRAVHCARKRASHQCSGRVTIDRKGMTLQCPLCGDHRSVYPS